MIETNNNSMTESYKNKGATCMAKLTVNSAIELVNTLRTRLEDMKNLRDRNISETEGSTGQTARTSQSLNGK